MSQFKRWGAFAELHAEKGVLGIAAIALGCFVWQASQPGPTIATPRDILQSADGIRQRLNGPGESFDISTRPIVAFGVMHWGPFPNDFNPPVLRPNAATQMPPLLSPVEVQVNYVRAAYLLQPIPKQAPRQQVGRPPVPGHLPLATQPAAVQTAGRRVAIVTAAVPAEDQARQFYHALYPRYFGQRLQPVYAGYRLQRARWTGSEWSDWELVHRKPAADPATGLQTQAISEPAATACVHADLTMVLPARIGEWADAEVIHPRIPAASDVAAEQPAPVAPPAPHPARPTGVFQGWGLPAPQQPVAPAPPARKPYLLLRALDETVEPEAMYRYRVQLVVGNPLYQTRHPLTPAALTDDPYLLSPWSMASDEVRTTPDWELFAGQIRAASYSKPAAAKVLIRQWDLATGATVAAEFAAERGQVLNFSDVECCYRNPAGLVQKGKFRFHTQHMLVDLGEKLPTRSKRIEPSQLLLVHESGSSSLGRFEDADREEYEAITAEIKTLADEFDRQVQPRSAPGFELLGP